MTNIDIRTIVSEAAKGFDSAAIEEACEAAAAVPQSDDLPAYASQVAEAVRRVLAGVLTRRQADLRRSLLNEQIQMLTAWALRQPITQWH